MEEVKYSQWVLERVAIGDTIRLREGVTTLGRMPDCTIRLFSTFSSRIHCKFNVLSNGRIFLKDFSSNGTFVNAHQWRSQQVELAEGDRIGIGCEASDQDCDTGIYYIYYLRKIPLRKNVPDLNEGDWSRQTPPREETAVSSNNVKEQKTKKEKNTIKEGSKEDRTSSFTHDQPSTSGVQNTSANIDIYRKKSIKEIGNNLVILPRKGNESDGRVLKDEMNSTYNSHYFQSQSTVNKCLPKNYNEESIKKESNSLEITIISDSSDDEMDKNPPNMSTDLKEKAVIRQSVEKNATNLTSSTLQNRRKSIKVQDSIKHEANVIKADNSSTKHRSKSISKTEILAESGTNENKKAVEKNINPKEKRKKSDTQMGDHNHVSNKISGNECDLSTGNRRKSEKPRSISNHLPSEVEDKASKNKDRNDKKEDQGRSLSKIEKKNERKKSEVREEYKKSKNASNISLHLESGKSNKVYIK